MHPKLLLADDSVTIQRVIELTFADEEVTVVAVGDGQQAIDRVRSDRPDIVLADVGMPERDGYEVAAFIKGDPEFAHIPVLLLTGAFEPIDEARARAVGCDGVLVKPFEPQMVISRVRDLLAGNRVGAPTGGCGPRRVGDARSRCGAGGFARRLLRSTRCCARQQDRGGARHRPGRRSGVRARRAAALGTGGCSAIDARGSGSDRLEPRHVASSGADPGPDPVDRSVPGPSPERAQPVVPLAQEKPAGVPAQAVPVPPIPPTL